VTREFNQEIIDEFRANEGRVGGWLAGTPIILLHHVGAKSGIERVTPLAYDVESDDKYAIVASNGGSPTHPAWYYNLKANPRVEIEVGRASFPVRAEELHGTARVDLLAKLVAMWPSLREHRAKTTRPIPVFVLTRTQ
jgi:deazaflavin-dependent oxidoreductase (nitroreductase family)